MRMGNWLIAIVWFTIGLIILLSIVIAIVSDIVKLYKLEKDDREKIKGGW